MKRVIIVGSPRTGGRSDHLAEMLFEANIDERPEDELFLVPVSEIDVGPCVGCDACRGKMDVTLRDDQGNEVTEKRHRCIYDDDMQMVYDLLDDADAITVVCPVFFSGAPAPMKCLLDRLQPYYWAFCENGPIAHKRPLELHVIGEGGDPHGYGPLVSEVRSAFVLAGFDIARIMDWVGKIDKQGEITAEAVEVEVDLPLATGRPKALELAADGGGAALADVSASEPDKDENAGVSGKPGAARDSGVSAQRKQRPKLNLSGGKGVSGERPSSGGRDPLRGKPAPHGGKAVSQGKKEKANAQPKASGAQSRKRKGGRRG